MHNNDSKDLFLNEIKSQKYIDNYIDKWLKLGTADKPYVECDICGYVSNASIHQHLLIPKEYNVNYNENRIMHLCANCNYELRALIAKHEFEMSPETVSRISEGAFLELKEKKKHYREMNGSLDRIVV